MAELAITDLPPAVPAAGVRPVSPAAHLADLMTAATVTGRHAVTLREIAHLTMIGIRAEIGSGAAERLGVRLGAGLPTRCGTVRETETGSVLWLAPDEFLAVSSLDAATLTGELITALHGEPGSVTDLSANRTTFELVGPSARSVLEKGCSLDLHPRAFDVGTAYVTALAGIPVVVWRTAEQSFRVLPRSSFADHVGRWLIDAMAEFGSLEAAGLG